jgi:adenosylmethionine-8-amino-7-oxononanoate aminotransferase
LNQLRENKIPRFCAVYFATKLFSKSQTTMNNQSFIQRDAQVLWHPCTQMKDHETLPVVPIKSGKGVWLEDFDGNRYLDAISSWWVNLFGHANPHINQALKNQLDSLEHVILSGMTHDAAITLAEKLVEITPANLSKCFYADSGSAAIEVALKMSFHYWQNRGQKQKTKFITLDNSYHGETLGALAMCNLGYFKETYAPLLMDVITVPSPDCFHREVGESTQDYSVRQFALMEKAIAENAESVAAVIVEPLVQGAGRMRMYDPIYLSLLRAACDKYNVHLIADEIAVGFGRTGTLFACEQAGISPDFMCLSKGLTGGYLPLSVVLTHDEVYQAFYDDYQNLTAFLHSHSYCGNPLGCRAGVATIEIFQQQNIIEKNKALSVAMATATARFNEHSHVIDVRQTGMILAIEFVKNKQTGEAFAWQERRNLKVYQYALSKGLLLRPIGNVIYFMPPYVITEQEIHLMADVTWDALNFAVQG